MSDTIANVLMLAGMAFLVGCVVIIISSAGDLADVTDQHREDYGLGSVVATTAEYEYLTNDSFTGVVVGGDCIWDPVLSVRNTDGLERTISIEFLEPV